MFCLFLAMGRACLIEWGRTRTTGQRPGTTFGSTSEGQLYLRRGGFHFLLDGITLAKRPLSGATERRGALRPPSTQPASPSVLQFDRLRIMNRLLIPLVATFACALPLPAKDKGPKAPPIIADPKLAIQGAWEMKVEDGVKRTKILVGGKWVITQCDPRRARSSFTTAAATPSMEKPTSKRWTTRWRALSSSSGAN